MFGNAYEGRRVQVTGHTGFKGSWLSTWLLELGAQVSGYARDVPTQPSHYEVLGLAARMDHHVGDVRDLDDLLRVFATVQPEIVFHFAAQPIVRTSYASPVETFATNALGTVHVLEAIRQTDSVRAAVFITSDKCYRNVEWTWGYRENDQLGGDDPYSASKACAELSVASYMASYFATDGPRIATTRAGNVVGGGDWAEDRIVPDCMRAWSNGQPVQIRNPNATRPWQHVLEPLSGYLHLAERLLSGHPGVAGEAFNFGPQSTVTQSVAQLLDAMADSWEAGAWQTPDAKGGPWKESTLLKLNCDKALNVLGWRAVLPFDSCVRLTSDWYRTYYGEGPQAAAMLTPRQITEYSNMATSEGLAWTK
jgi:CDP-glucose 4,6-dehydratase